jgi:nicotinamidase-related amidase
LKPAVIIVDMLEDTCAKGTELAITPHARSIIPRINSLLDRARARDVPVIFACDSFLAGDFIFRGKMNPHSLRGTSGARVVGDIGVVPTDIVLEKRRFSAFFKTDLDMTLRTMSCDTIAVGGITTNVCVLSTVLDGLANDFKVLWLTDCCAAHKTAVHEATLSLYEKSPLEPLLRLQTSEEFLKRLSCTMTGARTIL